MEHDEWFTLAELAERLGGLVWVEGQLADVFASWSAVEVSAPVAVFFASAGKHHGWHSEVIRSCLPTSPALCDASSVRAPSAGWQAAGVTLRNLVESEATAARLKAVVKVIDPWLDREIGALQNLARPISDAAMSRWLRFVALDHHEDGEAAATLLAARSSAPARFEDHVVVNELDLT